MEKIFRENCQSGQANASIVTEVSQTAIGSIGTRSFGNWKKLESALRRAKSDLPVTEDMFKPDSNAILIERLGSILVKLSQSESSENVLQSAIGIVDEIPSSIQQSISNTWKKCPTPGPWKGKGYWPLLTKFYPLCRNPFRMKR